MDISLRKSSIDSQNSVINITGSKSETNRMLLLQALFPTLILENISNSDDSDVMTSALQNSKFTSHNSLLVDVHHAGTAMRFLTAFFTIQEGKEVILTGSSRMKERPIKILVDALQQLGADISYLEEEGFPPLKIKGGKLTKNKVSLNAEVSSQYISALLLIAPKLENGLELTLEGEITSKPYIDMTLALLNEIGVVTAFDNNVLKIKPAYDLKPKTYKIESDWSSASYFYSIIALATIGTNITLSSFKQCSLQGDSVLAEIYKDFGVETVYKEDRIMLKKVKHGYKSIRLNLANSPDIAQTIAVTCFGLGLGCRLDGLHTLRIKETDRLRALKSELSALGATVIISNNGLIIAPSTKIKDNCRIKTYQDHRMAMAFAPLALLTNIIIEEAEVVSKSYPTFWEDLKSIGFQLK